MPREGGWLKRNRANLDRDWRSSWRRNYFSPAVLGLYHRLAPRLREHASGRFLDAGCGVMPYKELVVDFVDKYESLDIERRVPDVDFVGDIEHLQGFASETYDSILCSEVLEHVPRPDKALAELKRILKSHGTVILSVPFLGRLHDGPHDYFRYTKHGLRFMLERAGFRVSEIAVTGSIFSFLGHQVASLAVLTTYGIPVLREVVFWLAVTLCVLPCHWIDRLLPIRDRFPLGYVAVALRE